MAHETAGGEVPTSSSHFPALKVMIGLIDIIKDE